MHEAPRKTWAVVTSFPGVTLVCEWDQEGDKAGEIAAVRTGTASTESLPRHEK